MPQMTVTEVEAILAAEKADALSSAQAADLANQRSAALEYYLGEMTDMPSPADRSKAVSSDVAETIEGMMPPLMEIFASGDDVVAFTPVGQEDEEAAVQETDYINHIFNEHNSGFLVLYTFIKDSLLSKNGIVKCWWEETEREENETHKGLSDVELGLLLQGEGVEVIDHSSYPASPYPDPAAEGPLPPVTLHDVTIVRRQKYACTRVEAVPPEEFGISRRAKLGAMQSTDYCYHETVKTEEELIANGFDADSIKALPDTDFDDTEEAITRDTVSDRSEGSGASNLNRSTRKIRVTEHYCRMTYNGDKPRLYRVTTAGDSGKVIDRNGEPAIEEVEEVPFVAMTPYIMTHRFFGRSAADMVLDIQRIKTSILRALLDSMYLANNQRTEIAESHASRHTIDDLLTNRPGGIVRTKQPGGLQVMQNADIGPFAYPLLEYWDNQREWRTGVSRQGQGIGSESLKNVGQEVLLSMLNQAQAKIRLIARIFAETGIRDLFRLIHAITRRNATKADTVRLRGKWINIDPSQWRRRDDMTVTVGLGSGSRPQQIAFLTTLLGLQREAIMAPGLGLVKPKNIYNTLKRLIEANGMRSIDPYFTDPDVAAEQQPQEPPPDPKMIEVQGKMQLAQKEAEAKMTAEVERIRLEHEARIAEMAMKERLQMRQQDVEAELRREQMRMEAELKFGASVIDSAAKAQGRELTPVRMGGEVG